MDVRTHYIDEVSHRMPYLPQYNFAANLQLVSDYNFAFTPVITLYRSVQVLPYLLQLTSRPECCLHPRHKGSIHCAKAVAGGVLAPEEDRLGDDTHLNFPVCEAAQLLDTQIFTSGGTRMIGLPHCNSRHIWL